MKKAVPVSTLILLVVFSLWACTFDYGELEPSEREFPDLVMENVEYVRVRSADPIARFLAERAERYENKGLMRLENFSFEQFGGERGEDVNAAGKAGQAAVNINTGDIFMDEGVRLEVDSEDIIIETFQLEWRDENRFLLSGDENEVNILQENGTSFSGIGLFIDVRRRTWEFLGEVNGTFIHDDDDQEDSEAEAAENNDDQI